jgi:hypothetical protein
MPQIAGGQWGMAQEPLAHRLRQVTPTVRANAQILVVLIVAGCGGRSGAVGADGAADGAPGDVSMGAGGTGLDGLLDSAGASEPDGRADLGGLDRSSASDVVTEDRPPSDGLAADTPGTSYCPGDRRPDESLCNPGTARPCALSTGATCRCEPICGGPARPPGMDHSWSCRQPEPTSCPQAMPADSQACLTEGLMCFYPATAPRFCSGWSARCQGGRWMVTLIPPPP